MKTPFLSLALGLFLALPLAAAELAPELTTALAAGRAYAAAHPPKTGRFEPDIKKMLAAERAEPAAEVVAVLGRDHQVDLAHVGPGPELLGGALPHGAAVQGDERLLLQCHIRDRSSL